MNRVVMIAMVLFTASCSPARLQQSTIDGIDRQGRTIYRMTGFTDPEEVAAKSSTHHIEEALSEVCPTGVVILTQNEYLGGSMISNFLSWSATARCK